MEKTTRPAATTAELDARTDETMRLLDEAIANLRATTAELAAGIEGLGPDAAIDTMDTATADVEDVAAEVGNTLAQIMTASNDAAREHGVRAGRIQGVLIGVIVATFVALALGVIL